MRTCSRNPSRFRPGMSYVLALLVLAVLSTLAVALVAITDSGLRQADNSRSVLNARLAAESGLEFTLHQLKRARLPGDTTEDTFLDNLCIELGRVLDGTPSLQGQIVTRDTQAVYVPDIPVETGAFRSRFRWEGDGRCQLLVTGTSGPVSRRVSLDLVFVSRRAAVFDYGIASRGQVNVSGNASIIGVNYPTEANVLSATESVAEAIQVAGNVTISGDLFVSGEETRVTISGTPSVGGTSDAEEILSRVRRVALPDFPAIDTEPFEQLAVNVVDAETDIGNKTTFDNIVIRANTDPVFSNQVTLNGVVFIEAPNNVTFVGGVTINGIVVTEESSQPIANCQLHFAGHVEAQGVEVLPDTPEFAAVKEHTGTFVLAPGFGVTFAGTFSAVNGSIAADQLTFTGTAEGTVKGSVIGLKDLPTEVGGNVDIFVDRLSADPEPAGFVNSFALEADPDSYGEPVGAAGDQ